MLKLAWFLKFIVMLGCGLIFSGCANAPSTLDPQGPAASAVATLWWTLFWSATAIFVIVMLLLAWALLRPRHDQGVRIGDGRWFTGIGGGLIPALILVGVMIVTVGTQRAISTPTSDLTILVIGHQWWWEVRYPDQSLTTANEIHIPAGRPVTIKLTSADVIHSFWVPQLQVKMDLNPGQTNTTWIQADHPGVFRGVCAEYCGLQHTQMEFLVVADPIDQFNAWLVDQQKPAAAVTDPDLVQGQQIFMGSACVYCHTIRGTTASGTLGPDLTHLASRRTLGAGVLPNNTGSLSGWIVNAQAIKPGNKMPPMYLDGDSLHALVRYLNTLK